MPRHLCALLAVALVSAPACAASLEPLAVRDGQCECVLASEHPDDQFLLIVGSLARGGGPFPVRVTSTPTQDREQLPLDNSAPDPAWRDRVQQLAERLERARKQQAGGAGYPPLAEPPRQKLFHLFI